MDIRQLRYLASLARERHFARAAEACGVAQPTLSAGLRQLEDELGVMVVERGNRFKGFTPEGERVLAWAQRILGDCNALEQELVSMRKSLKGRLVLGIIPSALPMAVRLTRAFLARHEGVALKLLSRSSIEIQRGLDSFDLHAGITYLDNEPLTHVRGVPIYRERYVLLGGPQSGLAGRASIGWAEAASQPLCLLVPEMQNRRIVDLAFTGAGLQVEPVVETDSIAAALSHVREAGLCAVAAEGLIERLGVDKEIVAVPLVEPGIVHEVGLVIADREPMPSLVGALWRVAQELSA